MKTTLHVMVAVALVVIAAVQVQKWNYGDDMSQAAFVTMDVINKDDGTAEVIMVFTLDHHVDMSITDSNDFAIIVYNEAVNLAWTDDVYMYQYDKDYHLAGRGR